MATILHYTYKEWPRARCRHLRIEQGNFRPGTAFRELRNDSRSGAVRSRGQSEGTRPRQRMSWLEETTGHLEDEDWEPNRSEAASPRG